MSLRGTDTKTDLSATTDIMRSCIASESHQHNKLGAMSLDKTQRVLCSGEKEAISEAVFLENLYLFMRNRGTPIERIPYLGFKQLDLFLLYKTVQNFGGFNQVTANQKWKHVYNMLGGDPRSTSAATCTRRHYQKLLLPFECHLKGQEEVALMPPQQQKRSRQNYFPDKDFLGAVKRRALEKQMNAAFFKQPQEYLTDSCIQSIPLPMNVQQYPYPGFPPQAMYCPDLSSMLLYTQFQQPYHDPQPQPHIRHHQGATFELDSVKEHETPKQELLTLRKLAVEYLSSSGWEEPLDLTHKDRSLDNISQCPSSFSLTKGNNTPKFLNKVSPMYSSWNTSRDEGDVSGNIVTNKGENMNNKGQEQTDTQSYTASSPSVILSPIPLRKSCSPPNQFNQNLSADALSPKALERNSFNSDEEEEEHLLNLKHSLSDPTTNVEHQKFVEIPLKLLEAHVKSKLDAQNICDRGKTVRPISNPDTVKENYYDIKKSKAEFPMEKDASVLGYNKFESKRCLGVYNKIQNSLAQQNSQLTSSVNRPWDKEVTSDAEDTIKTGQEGGIPRVCNADDANIWAVSQCKDPETLKLLYRKWQYVQNLMMGLNSGMGQPTSTFSNRSAPEP
ncbi:hypothetical protein GN956_G19398 [Arapaima gigas]